jgi:DNA mismatch repair protein MutH
VIVNDELPSRLLGAYAEEGQVPVEADTDRITALGLEPVSAAVMGETDTVRHDPEKLATVVLGIVDRTVAERATLVKLKPSAATAARASG